MIFGKSPRAQFIRALLLSSAGSLALYLLIALRHHDLTYGFMFWNLFLAWVPFLLAIRLVEILKTKLWSTWEALALSVGWLAFLPNTFYIVSDLIHLQRYERGDVLYDAVMLMSFAFTGLALGFASLYLIHLQLKKRLASQDAAGLIGLTLLLSSVAIYLGRDLRWNSWDILINPGGLLFDVSDRLRHPAAYPQMLLTIAIFFILLSSMYYLVFTTIKLLQSTKQLHIDK